MREFLIGCVLGYGMANGIAMIALFYVAHAHVGGKKWWSGQ